MCLAPVSYHSAPALIWAQCSTRGAGCRYKQSLVLYGFSSRFWLTATPLGQPHPKLSWSDPQKKTAIQACSLEKFTFFHVRLVTGDNLKSWQLKYSITLPEKPRDVLFSSLGHLLPPLPLLLFHFILLFIGLRDLTLLQEPEERETAVINITLSWGWY